MDAARQQEKFERLIQLGIALSAERNHSKLLETILAEAQHLTNADGGTIYMNSEADELEFAVVRNNTLNLNLVATGEKPINLAPLPLYDASTGAWQDKNVASYAALHETTINIADAYDEEEGFDFSGTWKFDRRSKYRSTSFLTIPMKERNKGKVIGVLQLINAIDPVTGDTISFKAEDVAHVEALASQAAVAIDNQNLIDAHRQLLEAIINLMANAIDAKSPYTGGHCARVPDLAKRLSEAAIAADQGQFSDFTMTEDEIYEFHIASWLHDCGKVTTPEYVVDKSTKLETIYNRIHEIRTRFEVLRRDAESEFWKAVAKGGDEAQLRQSFDDRVAALADDFAFVAECNMGGEYMDPERKVRLREIAKCSWSRHFDDRLGLSQDEMTRLAGIPASQLPAQESLLTDKVEHLVPRDDEDTRPSVAKTWGFNVTVPKQRYNLGELYNLSIDRGTLTAEERFKINDHIVQTIIMLESLPWPAEMKRVPEFAGGHHEKMDGTGYPKGLSKNDMSVPARIMAIADIFEALTASDRPYKKPKTLNEAIRIMSYMKKEQHIDGDLFQLFLESGIYLEYAKEFLAEEQIDEVDIDEFLNS
jgi:HD-GYP domain-containing protein (c-di-GMP phosphodiesterase class II)